MEKTRDPNRRSQVGTALFIAGSTVLITYSLALAWQFQTALASTAIDSLGFFGSLGLASLHIVRIAMLDHAAMLSILLRTLVLCSAFIVMLIGIILLPKRGVGSSAPGKRALPSWPKGGQ